MVHYLQMKANKWYELPGGWVSKLQSSVHGLIVSRRVIFYLLVCFSICRLINMFWKHFLLIYLYTRQTIVLLMEMRYLYLSCLSIHLYITSIPTHFTMHQHILCLYSTTNTCFQLVDCTIRKCISFLRTPHKWSTVI